MQAVGQDLRALAAAADQLASDFPGEPLTESVVRKYFGGRAEVKSFAIADAALYGRTAVALEELRWALDNGTASVLVTSAFATGLRGLARFKSAPRGLREADLAREAGVPPWKIRVLREQARGWDDLGLATAITAVARADADVKGAGRRRGVLPGADGADDHRRARAAAEPAVPSRAEAPGTRTRRRPPGERRLVRGVERQSDAAFLLIADFLFAAWFLWMTPLEAALSSLRPAAAASVWACSASPASAASRKRRTADFSADFTDLLRSCAASFCRLRLIWDLMFATGQASIVVLVGWVSAESVGARSR